MPRAGFTTGGGTLAEIRAPITGSIWEVHAAEGQEVAAGDIVAIIESMKLEIPVEAETGGTVEQVHVEVGAAVGEDDVMFTLS
jgi:acetyl-CoA carboxylase biotin carboxyl carrier protein